MSGRTLVSLLAAILLFVSSGRAQSNPDPRNIDGTAFGEGVDISSMWLFTPTDSPAYASPTFDDRSWTIVSTSKPLSAYNFRRFGICWYRVHVHLPPRARNLDIVLSGTSGSYQVFANGIQIGGPTTLGPSLMEVRYSNVNYRIPNNALERHAGELVLALRFAPDRLGGEGGLTPIPLGDGARIRLVSADAALRDASYAATHADVVSVILGLFCCLVALVALALYLVMRANPEYFAAAIFLLSTAAGAFGGVYFQATAYGLDSYLYFFLSIAPVYVSSLEFPRLVLRLPRSRFLLTVEIVILIAFSAQYLFALFDYTLPVFFSYGVVFFLHLAIIYVLWQGWRRHNPDTLLLVPVYLLNLVAFFWDTSAAILSFLHAKNQLPVLPSVHLASYSLSFHDLGDFAYPVTILLLLVLRTVRIARERARVAGEIEAAQSMQQLLLARSSEPTPGFAVESVYLPASEVGGDFFLVSPAPDGSLTAIVGDVSGKGLRAAMRVAMILGVLRREESREPASILRSLNHALLAQGEMGFTTACCVHLRRDGRYTLANAGHIAPYSAGRELETEPALPLGLADDQLYAEVAGRLAANEKLVLMSDGVVEARSAKGELYGFERLQALTLQPAAQIAEVAQHFGQEDDITVVTLACIA